jgi:hypothetical protein
MRRKTRKVFISLPVSNLRNIYPDNNVPIKVKNNFEIKRIKEKPKTFQLKNNFFKDQKPIETNGIELSIYALKNLPSRKKENK